MAKNINIDVFLNWLEKQADIGDYVVGKLVRDDKIDYATKPYVEGFDPFFTDISKMYAFKIPYGLDGFAYLEINEYLIDRFEIYQPALQELAIHNMGAPVIKRLDDIINKMTGVSIIPYEDVIPLYVVTTSYYKYGAFYLCDAVMLEDICEEVCEDSHRNVIFIASSQDEIMVVSDPQMSVYDIKNIVHDCNREESIKNDALTDSVFIFDRDNERLKEMY